ncbi:MAG: hypothetical protein A2566_03790 [Candidatus Zambryskibacteria bacterium RIFOXYD1_FULL_40_13]|nr:MAG: Ribosomal RNA adenine dimethylase [Parcubacteria group bacterium GW2011_GWC1_39_12]KKR19270.1 MAG: Ribosomal RNA adenine dimethylase [Parcubacteria group bacterium GW2011_GWF1_39_37]KKR35347.1 MAG: Ribosomal RNA adenine dimethylase [Parcubacteria group bacterium GW2011_GWC2_40_10]KKR52221.1 MAG: Ribosomal RNA adenine dimethylase [Parcubacteria group bacterium GW2011_GWE1_40_20]KKR65719.1 MAG: Ribosomal RNA adenine dimethylase [Parcubacteria group bacterium GW2011_GWB1_40_5]KKR69263.1 M
MKAFFLKNFLKNWKEVGSITPSSRFLTSKMLKHINFLEVSMIVELGPGTGVFTREMLSRMKPEAELIALETNSNFFDLLREIKDSRLTLSEVSAGDLSSVLGGKKVDAIVSGIPFSAIKKEVREKMLYEIKDNIKEGGIFIQFQYSLDLHKLLNKIFENNVKLDFVPLNVPPAFVYTCKVK